MAFDNLLKEARAQEFGIINEIEITLQDLYVIMSELDSEEMKTPEMREKRKEYRGRFEVESDDNSANLFDFWSLKEKFVDNWFKMKYIVSYQGVPLRLLKENRTTIQT